MPHSEMSDAPLEIGGLQIQCPDRERSFRLVLGRAADEPVRVGWIYANCVNVAARDATYRRDAGRLEFLFNDGAGIELAAYVLGHPVRDNLCGTDWIPELMERLDSNGPWRRVFLLGGTAEAASRASAGVQQRWPALNVVGAHHGYFEDAAEALAAIDRARPEILIVGMGVPRQERFLVEHWPALKSAGVRIAIAGGAIIDHLAGTVTRAPRLMRRLRLEWLWRLLTEPRRLWRRYVFGNIEFLYRLVRQWLTRG